MLARRHRIKTDGGGSCCIERCKYGASQAAHFLTGFACSRRFVDYRATLTNDAAKLERFNEACLRRGVLKGGSKIYVSCAHTEADVERTLGVFEDALTA